MHNLDILIFQGIEIREPKAHPRVPGNNYLMGKQEEGVPEESPAGAILAMGRGGRETPFDLNKKNFFD